MELLKTLTTIRFLHLVDLKRLRQQENRCLPTIKAQNVVMPVLELPFLSL